MSTSELAIVVSVLSVAIAAFALGWNVYRDIVLKARVKVYFGVRMIFGSESAGQQQCVSLTATNYGPGLVNLKTVVMKNTSFFRWLFRKREHAIVSHNGTNPLSGQLPKKLDVGEEITLLFPYDEECFLHKNWSHVGLFDNFGRTHWARTRDVKGANNTWKEDFPSKEQVVDQVQV